MPKKTSKKGVVLSPPVYETRIVLFLDFLGFRELVDRTTREPGALARIVEAMEVIGKIGSDNRDVLESQRITQFSDSVVVSYLVTERSAVFWLLLEIALHVIRLAEMGFLVRGGVTVGQLYHSSRHVMGPAMNEAYRLESQVAKYPRIVVDPKMLTVARRARNLDNSAHEEEAYVRAFLTPDLDGHLFLDYVSWESVVDVVGGDNEFYGDYLGKLGTLIRDGLRHDDPRVQEKYLWLQRQYARAIARISGLAHDDPYRLRNGALCDQISRLPRLKVDTKMAVRAVKKSQVRAQGSAKKKKKKKNLVLS
ncbi:MULTISPECIES: hypothetical protein [unclassified Caballeronia]|uniref:hypothetical protein n=1 Tax=unclassified Caballeronia TaxID=2646786 RepID=UPI00202957F8|nr:MULTISPECIES: hypothetical protein [unclassified Caballeronia]